MTNYGFEHTPHGIKSVQAILTTRTPVQLMLAETFCASNGVRRFTMNFLASHGPIQVSTMCIASDYVKMDEACADWLKKVCKEIDVLYIGLGEVDYDQSARTVRISVPKVITCGPTDLAGDKFDVEMREMMNDAGVQRMLQETEAPTTMRK